MEYFGDLEFYMFGHKHLLSVEEVGEALKLSSSGPGAPLKPFLLVNSGKPSQVQLGTIQARRRPRGFITRVSVMLRKVWLSPCLGGEIVQGSVRKESYFCCIT